MIFRKIETKYIILIIGLVAYTFSGLNWNIGIAAWLAPFLLLYYSKSSKWSGILFLILGLAIASAVSKSAENLSGIFLIYITTGLGYGLVYSLPFVLEKLLSEKEEKFYTTLVFPSAVVIVDYLLSLLIGIWGSPAIAQYNNINLIQISSVFGVFGISFLVAWFASTLNWVVINWKNTKRQRKGLIVYGSVLLAVLLLGIIRTGNSPVESEKVKVAAIVSKTDIHQVFSEWEEEIIELSKDYNQEIPAEIFSDVSAVRSQIKKTQEALANNVKIVVWNEISLILEQSQADSLVQKIKKLCLENQAYVLLAVLEKNSDELPLPFDNISILVTPGGEIAWEYRKHWLQPLERLIINKGEAPIPYIDTEYGRIANAICSDLDFTSYISQIGKEDVDILLVPSFDWEEVTPYHSNMAAFAAIQYGVCIVRANGKGIVSFLNHKGEVFDQHNTFISDSEIFYAEIPMNSATTVYSVLGNLFVFLLMLLLLIIVGIRITKRAAS